MEKKKKEKKNFRERERERESLHADVRKKTMGKRRR